MIENSQPVIKSREYRSWRVPTDRKGVQIFFKEYLARS